MMSGDESDKICKDGASKSNIDDVCDVNDKLKNMNTDDNSVLVCANCGKDGANNVCAKCKQVNYCNAKCKKVHKKKHKKQCDEHVKLAIEKHNEELRIAAELHDENLFKQPPLEEDCPICFLRIPFLKSGSRYYECCGKVICSGCYCAPLYDNQGNEVDNKKCPYCRTPHHASEEELLNRYKIRMEAGDPIAIYNIGRDYRDGVYGLTQDHTKALEYYQKAAEFGFAEAYSGIGYSYHYGEGVEVDKKKANHSYELAATKGDVIARYNLGIEEENEGNMDRALKHYMIAVRSGHTNSLKQVKELYSNGYATKEDYTKALQSYQVYLTEIKSKQRDKAAADNENCRYY